MFHFPTDAAPHFLTFALIYILSQSTRDVLIDLIQFSMNNINYLFFFYASVAGLTMCQKERQVALGWKGIPSAESFVPTCRPDGEYNVVQCHSSLSICWCVEKNGIEKQGTRSNGIPSCGLMGGFVGPHGHTLLTI